MLLIKFIYQYSLPILMQGKTIIVCVTGSIAAFKITEVIKILKQKGANVEVLITKNGKKLVDIEEFKQLCPVRDELFNPNKTYKDYLERKQIPHTSISDRADLFLIAPATANTIGKIANGIADELVSTSIMSTNAPIILAPAMNCKIWANELVKQNVQKLKDNGYYFIEPEYGQLACGVEGKGRLAKIETIVEEIELFFSNQRLSNKRILITAGPTIEQIDPVRFISNKSSGKMGYALAKIAGHYGANVTLISGPTSLAKIMRNVTTINVKTAEEMYNEVMKISNEQDIIISAAAVADFKPQYVDEKIKKTENLSLNLEKNKDILLELGKIKKPEQKLVGFALETSNIEENAKAKLENKNLDLIVANTPEALNADESKVLFITKNNIEKINKTSKLNIAKHIFQRLVEQ